MSTAKIKLPKQTHTHTHTHTYTNTHYFSRSNLTNQLKKTLINTITLYNELKYLTKDSVSDESYSLNTHTHTLSGHTHSEAPAAGMAEGKSRFWGEGGHTAAGPDPRAQASRCSLQSSAQ